MLTDLRPERTEECISNLTFDAWRAGELGSAERSAAESHLSECLQCRERRLELDAAAAAFLEEFPVLAPSSAAAPRVLAKKLEPQGMRVSSAKLREVPRPLVGWAGAGLAAAAAVLLFVGVRTGTNPAAVGNEHATRLKGSDRIGFFVRRGQQVFEGSDGQRVRPGDQLRFLVTTAAPRHVAILARDAAGIASVYYPPASAHARSLGAMQDRPVESAVELDDTLGNEQLFGVFCTAPFELESLRSKLERDGKVPLTPGCTVDELGLVKERAP